MRTLLLALLLTSLLALCFSSTFFPSAHAPTTRPVINSQWTSSPPSIDGVVGSGEWSNLVISFTSSEYPDSYVLPTYVYFMNDAANLYVLVDAVGDTTNSTGDECLLIFDFNSDPTNGYTTVRIVQTGSDPITWDKSSSSFNAVIGFSGSPLHKVYEFSIPFSFLGGSAGDSFDFCSPYWKGGPSGGGSMPFDIYTSHDNVWPAVLGMEVGWKELIDGWGILNSKRQPQRATADPDHPVGGVILPVNPLAVLAPYLALIGLAAALSTVYALKRKRKT
ncbi:hypothetical protein [[Eubacterium] cellulosolvens]